MLILRIIFLSKISHSLDLLAYLLYPITDIYHRPLRCKGGEMVKPTRVPVADAAWAAVI